MKPKKKPGEVSLWFAIFIMILTTVVTAALTYQYASGEISVDVTKEGAQFFILNPTILEIVALIILLIFLTIWLYMRYKFKKSKKDK